MTILERRSLLLTATLAVVVGFLRPAAAYCSSEDSPNGTVQVCRRPLPKWGASRNWLLKALNRLIVRHVHHSYINLVSGVFIPTLGAPVHTIAIHPVGPANTNKQPLPDQITDNVENGGDCQIVKDATPDKMQRLAEEISTGTCYSCGKEYHNRVLSGCYNNSNTYVFDLISGAGMSPPHLRGAPGYRHHHACRL